MAPNKRGSSSDEGNDDRDLQLPLCKRKAALPDTRISASGSGSTNDMALILEPVIRKVLQEMMPPMLEQVIPPILQRYLPSPWGQISPPAGRGRSLQLCLMKGLPATIFTQINITAEDSSPLQVAVCDATIQNSKVTKGDGPSLKVQLCVLKADFESEDWTAEEFNSNIESPRDGKGPLLKGDTVITMENGVGFFKNVEFTDNSCWTRSGKFRLGIKVLSSNSDIKEARSERIRVKDKRGVANEKPDRPSLDDKVSCLRKIAKNGPIRKQLSSNGIKTVKDLLRLLTTDQASLKQKTGHIPGKSWEKIIEHAKSCAIDNDERYIYQYFTGTAEQPIAASLVLNCIYEPVAISFDGQNFCSLESLNSEGKRWVETVKRQAYKNLKDLKPFGASSAGQSLENFDFPVSHQQGQGEGQAQMVQASASTASGAQSVNKHQVGWEEFVGDSGWSNNNMNAIQVDPFQNYSDPVYPFYYVGGDYGATSSNDFDVHWSSKGGCNTVWAKIRTAAIRNVLKWAILYAAKRKPKLLVPYQ
ncbi:calmodulin-binding protein 60 B-like isoform X2 [Arachis stenosperma]|uniref:calmodulin-binding protein 60 B-like isoform X2 n=1 Tax=Arachis stenosperma TaxID=217475 RepID=UPI0025AD8F61|nr:calmodulin-binding protein 60 B-like isoform X2 [Arachis stenosperma]